MKKKTEKFTWAKSLRSRLSRRAAFNMGEFFFSISFTRLLFINIDGLPRSGLAVIRLVVWKHQQHRQFEQRERWREAWKPARLQANATHYFILVYLIFFLARPAWLHTLLSLSKSIRMIQQQHETRSENLGNNDPSQRPVSKGFCRSFCAINNFFSLFFFTIAW